MRVKRCIDGNIGEPGCQGTPQDLDECNDQDCPGIILLISVKYFYLQYIIIHLLKNFAKCKKSANKLIQPTQ